LAKTLKPDKPLRESLVSHRVITPEEEVRTIADRVQAIVEGREVIFFSILVAIVLALGGSGILWYLRSNESDLAREKLGQAYAGWREAVFPTGVPGSPPPAPAAPEVQIEKARAIEQVALDFPGTRPGAMANYLAGNAYAQAGSPDRAMLLLQAALASFDEKDPARPFAQRALAGARRIRARRMRHSRPGQLSWRVRRPHGSWKDFLVGAGSSRARAGSRRPRRFTRPWQPSSPRRPAPWGFPWSPRVRI
jgi:hypothetical protein